MTGELRLQSVSKSAPELPPLPSAGGTYVLDAKSNEWVLQQQTAEATAKAITEEPLTPQTDGPEHQEPPTAGEG